MAAPGRPEAVEASLLRRAEEAIEAADRIRAESSVVVKVSTALRGSGMVTRCAWCGRFRDGEHWVLLERMPRIAEQAETTHGICGDCLEALGATGMSV